MPDIEEEEEAGEAEAIEVMVVDIDMSDIEDMFNLLSVGYRVWFDDPSVLDCGGYCFLDCAENEASYSVAVNVDNLC